MTFVAFKIMRVSIFMLVVIALACTRCVPKQSTPSQVEPVMATAHPMRLPRFTPKQLEIVEAAYPYSTWESRTRGYERYRLLDFLITVSDEQLNEFELVLRIGPPDGYSVDKDGNTSYQYRIVRVGDRDHDAIVDINPKGNVEKHMGWNATGIIHWTSPYQIEK